MARPNKSGLDYFPFDVDFFEDEKIEAIFVEFGIKGEITVVKLLCAIYRNGYFILWNDRLKIKLLKNLPGVSSELLEQIIKRLVKWEFFNENLFNSASILTSTGIQKRFFSVAKRRKQNEEYPHLLINVCNNSVNDYNNDKNENNNPTKESKEKEVNNSLSNAQAHEVFPPPGVLERTLSECYSELSSNQSWAETVTMNTRAAGYLDFTLESFYEYLKQFFMEQQNKGEVSKSPKDAMSHFASWLKIELKKQEDDKRRAKPFKSTATNSAGKVVCSKTKEATDIQSDGAPQKDYSARF